MENREETRMGAGEETAVDRKENTNLEDGEKTGMAYGKETGVERRQGADVENGEETRVANGEKTRIQGRMEREKHLYRGRRPGDRLEEILQARVEQDLGGGRPK